MIAACDRPKPVKALTPGQAFAKKDKYKDPVKAKARDQVLDLYRFRGRKPLNLLTMPGQHWWFERDLIPLLIANNKGKYNPDWNIYGIESDLDVFINSLQAMPGVDQGISNLGDHVATKFGTKLFHKKVEDFIAQTDIKFDGMWLDFTGCISTKRVEILKTAFHKTQLLTVTLLCARFDRKVKKLIEEHESYENWLSFELGCKPVKVYTYVTGHCKMLQITWMRHK